MTKDSVSHRANEALKHERNMWALLARLVEGHRGQMTLLAVASFAGAMLEAGFLVLLTSTVVALAAGRDAVGPVLGVQIDVSVALVVASTALLIRLLLAITAANIAASLGARVRAGERKRLARAYLQTSWAVQQSDAAGRLQELLTSFVGRVNAAMLAMTQFVTAALSLIAFMGAGVVVDPVATLAVLGALGVLALALAPVRSLIRRTARESGHADVEFATTIAEIGSLGQEMRTFGVTTALLGRVERVADHSTAWARRVQVLHGVLSPIYTFLAYLAVVGGVAAMRAFGAGDLAALGAVMLLMLRSLSYGQQLISVTGQLASAAPAIEELDDTVARYAAAPAPSGSQHPNAATPINFQSVSFSYTPQRTALVDLDLTIDSGEMLGVIGPSGAGKSTIAQLVLGLRPPTQGRIFVDGVDLHQIDRTWWTRRVSFVPQDPLLFTGTVAENLRFFRDGIDTDSLMTATAQANVLADIERLPNGFDTHLGERGSQLSGGQRQRLSIARALVGRPQVLVLDEPTSALDGISEALIRETLAALQGKVTIVLIAHRMSTLDLCDRIMVVEEGRVTGLGRPADLRKVNGFYRHALQTAGMTS